MDMLVLPVDIQYFLLQMDNDMLELPVDIQYFLLQMDML